MQNLSSIPLKTLDDLFSSNVITPISSLTYKSAPTNNSHYTKESKDNIHYTSTDEKLSSLKHKIHFFEKHNLRIAIMTWNVNNCLPPKQNMLLDLLSEMLSARYLPPNAEPSQFLIAGPSNTTTFSAASHNIHFPTLNSLNNTDKTASQHRTPQHTSNFSQHNSPTLLFNADLIVFGFQEIDLTAQGLFFTTTQRCDQWKNALTEALNKLYSGSHPLDTSSSTKSADSLPSPSILSTHPYTSILHRQMVGLFVDIFAKTEHVISQCYTLDSLLAAAPSYFSTPGGILSVLPFSSSAEQRFMKQNLPTTSRDNYYIKEDKENKEGKEKTHTETTPEVRECIYSPSSLSLSSLTPTSLFFSPFLSAESTCVKTGLLNTLGNKGALCCRVRVGESVVSFAVAHLAAHQHALPARNRSTHAILQRATFTHTHTAHTHTRSLVLMRCGDKRRRDRGE